LPYFSHDAVGRRPKKQLLAVDSGLGSIYSCDRCQRIHLELRTASDQAICLQTDAAGLLQLANFLQRGCDNLLSLPQPFVPNVRWSVS
jgi:hypothetical protein